MEWEKERQVARQAALKAGSILSGLFGHVNRIMKKGEIDLVTEADLRAEKAILETIRQYFPRDSIHTEEAGEYRDSQDRVWLIDPLDGTTNFAHAFPFYAVSIALEVDREGVLGVVFNPTLNEYFEAVRGGGAFLNNKPIRVSQTREINDSLVATGFPYDIHENPHRVMELFGRMVVRAQGVRRPGSAAIDLCYVAAGRFDGFWEAGLKPWDTAAGIVLVSEAGGRLSGYHGEPYSPYGASIVASNGLIHDVMLTVLA